MGEPGSQDEALRAAARATSASVRDLQRRADRELLAATQALKDRTRELTASVSLLRATLESSPDGIIVRDLAEGVVIYNSRFLEMWSLSEKDVESERREIIASRLKPHFVDGELYLRRVRQAITQPEQAVSDEFMLRDGRTFERHAMPQWIDGRCVGVVVTWRDITLRKRAEAERLEFEMRLHEGQKLEALGTLAGGIAHDFNNVLAAILGNAALAREDALQGTPIAECLAEIERAGGRGRQLVQRILGFVRKQSQDFRWQPLQPVLAESVAMMRASLPAQATLHEIYPQAPMFFLGDAIQITQVVTNLLTNAWQALGGRPGRIDLVLDVHEAGPDADPARERAAEQAQYARLRVIDDGHGIDTATRARIFEPFFTTKPVGEGTGLGLALVHGIVTAHGGTITVRSVPGQGTMFEILLPVALALPEPLADASPAAAAAAQGLRMMYVDDDAALVSMMTRLMQRRGCRVSGYVSAEQALDALRASPGEYDLVVSDYDMPQRTGVEVAKWAAAVRPGIPVIVLSGFVTEDLLARARDAGVRRVLQKGMSGDDLWSAIAETMREGAPGSATG